MLEQARLKFHPKDPPHCVIDPGDGDRLFLDELKEEVVEAEVKRHHAHVDACHDADAHCLFRTIGYPVARVEVLDSLPVGDDKSPEVPLALENFRYEVIIRVAGNSVGLTRVNHDRHDTCPDAGLEG